MFIPSPKYYNLIFINRNQSIYYLRLANKNSSCSFFIPNSCTFCPWYADFLPRVRHQHSMSSLFINSGTYTSFSIVCFFNGNQSICHYGTSSLKYIPSSLIAGSGIFATPKADLLSLAQNQHWWCGSSLNTDTYQFTSIVCFFNGNQSIYYLCLQNQNIWNSPSLFIASSSSSYTIIGLTPKSPISTR